jgi:hypothetical protein
MSEPTQRLVRCGDDPLAILLGVLHQVPPCVQIPQHGQGPDQILHLPKPTPTTTIRRSLDFVVIKIIVILVATTATTSTITIIIVINTIIIIATTTIIIITITIATKGLYLSNVLDAVPGDVEPLEPGQLPHVLQARDVVARDVEHQERGLKGTADRDITHLMTVCPSRPIAIILVNLINLARDLITNRQSSSLKSTTTTTNNNNHNNIKSRALTLRVWRDSGSKVSSR